jgi:hypothetical protein
MIKFNTLLTQPIIVVRIGSKWNFDRWEWAALSDTMRVEVFKPNDLFPSLCDFRCTYPCIIMSSEMNSSFYSRLEAVPEMELRGFLGLGAELLPLDGATSKVVVQTSCCQHHLSISACKTRYG